MSEYLISSCVIGCQTRLRLTDVSLPEGPLRACPACGQLHSSCTKGQYEASLTRWNTTTGTLPDAASKARFITVATRRLKTARSMLSPDSGTARLLDVGCSSGSLLGVAKSLGFEVSGVETAPEAVSAARQAGFPVFQGALEDARFPTGSFDVITLIELVEHVADPAALLRECARLLRPGGVVVINTPNARSWTARFMKGHWDGFSLSGMGGHISFFSPQSMRLLASRTDFTVERIETRNVRFFEKHQVSPAAHRVMKILAQLLALPARLSGQGHDLLAYLRRP